MTPYTSVVRGIAAEAFCEAIEDARVAAEKEFGITLRWIFDISGEDGLPGADETLRIATKIRPDGLVGFGLGGPEIGVPRPQFQPHFEAAIAAGLHSVPHAGETTGPETIWDAVRVLKAERIGHGTSTMQDPALVDYLGEHRIPLEVSPTSNIATRAVASYDVHPLRAMVEAGLVVTINSDDPPMFGTDLTNEYAVAAQTARPRRGRRRRTGEDRRPGVLRRGLGQERSAEGDRHLRERLADPRWRSVVLWSGAESLWGAGRRSAEPCGLQRRPRSRQPGARADDDDQSEFADPSSPAGRR